MELETKTFNIIKKYILLLNDGYLLIRNSNIISSIKFSIDDATFTRIYFIYSGDTEPVDIYISDDSDLNELVDSIGIYYKNDDVESSVSDLLN